MNYHEALAELNVSHAHPGGKYSTDQWISYINPTAGLKVLDVGCGTGATAVFLAKHYGCSVTALDIRSKMLEKCKIRANQEGVDIDIQMGDIENLKFDNDTFDVVLCESVLVFVKQQKALMEIYRVLSEKGRFVDVEMVLTMPVNQEWKQTVFETYGAKNVWDKNGWIQLFQKAGFKKTKVLFMQPLRSVVQSTNYSQTLDLNSSMGKAINQQALSVIRENAEWMEKYSHTIGYGIFVSNK
ncbi:class I SAM-dependent methyltransferase [Alicyclobacillus tolerans]|uniref:Methyltransferase domain-containing protein n=2 Tax=Alicyclobacillus tolerans TaxID=90970 RepID=A0A1M6SDF9_9BACL|nr:MULTISPECIES: class I SAM-dependent methyltransferase [Alicyclobacillus]MDP9728658.1 ubiquinone/menaquinone biosynthesis C-methylase UbiE [Alicyclobacillus tengchongensis]SHK42783.1 Methyltransferase domain-containing protein [Alicyclobacillus montanus]